MTENLFLQSSFYKVGNQIGYYGAWVLTLALIILLIYVMVKFLDTSDLK